MNDNQKKALRIFLLSHGLGSVLFTLTFTVQAVYFIQTVHMDPLQLVLVGTTLEATIFLFELPTGVVALMPLSLVLQRLWSKVSPQG